MKLENSDLREENDQLTERINDLSYILTDLQDKAECAEEEKAGLITTIRLLYKDLGGNQPEHAHYHSLESTQPLNQPLGDQADGDKVLNPEQLRTVYPETPTRIVSRYLMLKKLAMTIVIQLARIQPIIWAKQ